ncbi:MAG: hypothetical protein AB3N13_10040 [Arenibacterium sp.]
MVSLFRKHRSEAEIPPETSHVLLFGRALALTTILFFSACAPQDVVAIQASAEFESFPTRLFRKAEQACSKPSETFVRLSKEVVECRLLLPPETTAAVILAYDGVVEELPQAVVRFAARTNDTGYVVDILPYLRVPRRGDLPLRIAASDPALLQQMQTLLVLSGGQIE